MKPPSRHRRPPAARGFTLLALVIVLLALGLLVFAALRQGEEARRDATLMQHEATAQAAAEAGLERTRLWLSTLRDQEPDFDRALDPQFNTDCLFLPLLSGATTNEDHLPPFTDGDITTLQAAGPRFRRVPHGDGAYLVRIDDNDDDRLLDTQVPPGTTGNHLGSGCLEGTALGPLRGNPVRDRDGVVVVTVVGLSPGTDPARAQAKRSLRVQVGPRTAAGIIAGGDIHMGGTSHVCGVFGNVSTTGSVTQGGCLCGAACNGGPVAQECNPGGTCVAEAAGPDCTATAGGSGSTCTPGMLVDPPPPVQLWHRSNAPPPCNGGVCTPFFYLRWSGTETQVHAWKYVTATCANPQVNCDRIPHPGDTHACASCWKLIYAKSAEAACPDNSVKLSSLVDNPTLAAPDPFRTSDCGSAEVVWRKSGSTGYSTGASCDSGTLYPGPAGSMWAPTAVFDTTFDYQPTGGALLPRGIWLVEGNVRIEEEIAGCAHPFTPPLTGVQATLMAQGDIVVKRDLSLKPAHPNGVVLLAGRDLDFTTGNGSLWTCDTPAAVLVHEQFKMTGNQQLQAQLIAENGGTCSATISGEAIHLTGNSTISVPKMPPVPARGPASFLSWSESSY
ncbi:MAG TPA: hypothetical protein VE153_38465 [Myxococcus sp.]|nr:hypothetical protein [Myxococcus sp.]